MNFCVGIEESRALNTRIAIRAVLALSTIVIAAGLAAYAQAPAPLIRFEVASIRPVPNGPSNADNPSFAAYRAGKATSFCMVCISGSHYDNYGAWLKVLIGEAFGVDSRLVVAPDWLNLPDATQFAIHAVMPEGATRERIPEMLRALLEERFHLVAHRAPAQQTGYALVVGKNGPKLKQPRDLDRSACEPWVESIPLPDGSANQICRTTRADGESTVNITMSTNTRFGPLLSATSRGESVEIHTEYFRVTMPDLAESLGQALSTGSPGMPSAGSLVRLVDRTGITGAWDVVLDRTPGDMALASVSASLERQGLRVERTTVPIEKLIVDKMDRVPTDN